MFILNILLLFFHEDTGILRHLQIGTVTGIMDSAVPSCRALASSNNRKENARLFSRPRLPPHPQQC